ATKSWSQDEKIDTNGIDDLKKPLLQIQHTPAKQNERNFCDSSCKSCTSKGSMNNKSWSPEEKREINRFDDDLKKPLLHIQEAEATPSTSTLNSIMVSATKYVKDANNIKETRIDVNELKGKETSEC
ncbi:hypothetical protein A2U01_0019021, partial [Trifolium medium]|nr:hypothetical protein [Trifolium medium]